MKKTIIVLAAATMMCVGAIYAALDASARIQTAVMIYPQTVDANTNATGEAVDKLPFTGVANVIAVLGVNTGATVTVQIQHAPNSTGTWANIAGKTITLTGTNGISGSVALDATGYNRYLRANVATTNAVAPVAVTINSFK